jgi:hypothetical protein
MDVLYKEVFEKFTTDVFEDSTVINYDKYDKFTNEFELFRTNRFEFKESSDSLEDFKKNYGNLLATCYLIRTTIVVERNDEKVSLKLFNFSKARNVGKPYFTKSSLIYFITYKFKENIFYYGELKNGNSKKRRTSMVRKNYFCSPTGTFTKIATILKNMLYSYNTTLEFNDIWSTVKKTFCSQIENLNYNETENIEILIYKFYLESRNIKIPNNWKAYLKKVPLPSKRLLKKFDNKLVDCFMFNKKLNGDKFKKILHELNYINEYYYSHIENFFGRDLVRNQPIEALKSLLSINTPFVNFGVNFLSKNETKKALQTLIDMVNNGDELISFNDHLRMYNELSEYEKIKWTANDKKTFFNEHLNWSEKLTSIKKGTYIREYNQNLVNYIQSFNIDGYYAKVLLTSYDYEDESFTQHNCVRTYIERPESFIISFRKNDITSNIRASIEYRISLEHNEIKLKRVQTLGKYNNKLDEIWTTPIQKLDEIIKIGLQKYKFELPKVSIIKLYEKYEMVSSFDNDFLRWHKVTPLI